jgi:hypothetical protein
MKTGYILFAAIVVAACGGGASNKARPDAAVDAPSSAKDLLSLSFLASDNRALADDVTATISGAAATALTPLETNRSALVATFTTTGASVQIAGVTQESGVTANDFTRPVTYRVVAHDGSTADYVVMVGTGLGGQQAYIKASNTAQSQSLGASIALSSDGNTLAIGAGDEASNATGVDGNQADTSAFGAGAVYVFTRSGTTWSQQAYIKASNTNAGDDFGGSVALSSDGNTLAVGAPFEASAATGVSGTQSDNTAAKAGAVYVFTRSNATWSQQAYVKASNTNAGDEFGFSLALSGDGNALVVGAPLEASAATGFNGNQADNTATAAGAVYVFTRSGTAWSQLVYVKASNTNANDDFGLAVAISADATTVAVGATGEASAAAGINGNQADNTAVHAGAVYVFTLSGQQAYIKASNTNASDFFGNGVALSSDGNTLAVGAFGESSAATGVGGNQSDNTASFSGAAYVFTRASTTWSQQAYIKASNTGAGHIFGGAVTLSGDGNVLAVNATGEASAATGLNGNQTDNTMPQAGAVYVLTRTGTTWGQVAYVKASNPDQQDFFGGSIALSSDGATLAAGAENEGSMATGIGGNQADNSLSRAGAAYVFR